MGGLGVAGPISSRQPGERFAVRLIFPFEDFELTLRLDTQMVYVLPDLPRFGTRFVDLSQGQLALFRYIVDAYLSGEIVSGGDILSVVGSDQAGEARVQKLFSALNEEDNWGRRMRRYVGIALMALAGVGLTGLIVAGLYQRFLMVDDRPCGDRGADLPARRHGGGRGRGRQWRSPAPRRPGRAADRRRQYGRRPAQPLRMRARRVAGSAWATAQPGQIVATLVAADQPLTVRAEVPLAAARRLRVGQIAEITVPGKPEAYRGQIERIDFRLLGRRPGEPADLGAASALGSR